MQFNFTLPAGELLFSPGQYLSIKLPEVRPADGQNNVRYFSLVSSPDQKKGFSIATRSSASAFKQALFNLSLDSEVEVGGVSGQLILPAENDGQLVLIAGGIGITSFMSMLTYANNHHSSQHFILLYSNQQRPAAPFLDELTALAETLTNFQLVLTMTDDEYWSGEKRIIDHQFIKDYVSDYKAAKYLVAGPPPLVLSMANNFDRLGIIKDNFVLEEYFGY